MTFDPHAFRRRDLLCSAAAAGIAALPILACAQRSPPASGRGRLIAGDTCPVTPRQTEGPFYFDPQLVRQNIAEGRPGVPLRMRLQIVDAADCAPLRRARVDVWHCDAAGSYSGYDSERSAGETFMRGTQLADANGVVTFESIYPGWSSGRAPHIHRKARTADGREIASQIYFPPELSDRLYDEAPYAGRSGRRLSNGQDRIFRSLDGRPPLAEIERTEGGYDAAYVFALR
jgi:protocatechuate 3,4-dioxygenase beta subunit